MLKENNIIKNIIHDNIISIIAILENVEVVTEYENEEDYYWRSYKYHGMVMEKSEKTLYDEVTKIKQKAKPKDLLNNCKYERAKKLFS